MGKQTKLEQLRCWLSNVDIGCKSCRNCKSEARKIGKFYRELNPKTVYMGVYIKGKNKWMTLPVIVLRPDFNSVGQLNHFHIEFKDEKINICDPDRNKVKE